jgi:hypothetical protein
MKTTIKEGTNIYSRSIGKLVGTYKSTWDNGDVVVKTPKGTLKGYKAKSITTEKPKPYEESIIKTTANISIKDDNDIAQAKIKQDNMNNATLIIEPKPEHPLVNNDSKHYEMIGGFQAIEIMEKMFSKQELMAWAKITSYKYRFRLGKKDDNEKDIKKMKTYEQYYEYLKKQEV